MHLEVISGSAVSFEAVLIISALASDVYKWKTYYKNDGRSD